MLFGEVKEGGREGGREREREGEREGEKEDIGRQKGNVTKERTYKENVKRKEGLM